MKCNRLLRVSEQWFRLLLGLYPPDFREEMGHALLEAYRDRAREALKRGGITPLARLWLAALADSLRNGPGERLRPAASWRRSGNWGGDAERVLRRFVRAPVFVIAIVATLAVGLGAFAVVYTAVDKILIEPMPYSDPEDLYFVWRDYTAYSDLNRGWLGGPDIAELEKAGGVIEAAAGMQLASPTLAVRPDGEPSQVTMMLISPNLFDMLGVVPALGRGFEPNEVGPKRPAVIVLANTLWKRLGADPSIIGSTVWLSGTPYTVIGVMPPEFRFVRHSSLGPPQAADLYIPFAFNLAEQNPGNGSFAGLIRARRGTSPEAVAAAVSSVGRFVDERDHKSRGLKLYPVALHADLVAPIRPALFALGMAAIFLVLVLTVNLASLLLARAAEREREFAVSRALGANSIAIVRAMVFEGGLLGVLGGITGAVAGVWGARMLVVLAPLDLPRRDAIALDWSIAAVVVGLGMLLGFLAAAIPATWASRVSLASLIAAAAVRGAAGPGRMRRGMVVAQVALCIVLLSSGGLVVRSFQHLLRADPGFRPEGVLTFFVVMGPRIFPENTAAFAFQDRVEETIAGLPGVTGVNATSSLPLRSASSQTMIGIPGAPGNTGDANRDQPLIDIVFTGPGYLDVVGMRLLAGRDFKEADGNATREALIDRHMANHFFPNSSPLGAPIPFGDGKLTIVGVVEHARLYDLHKDGRPQLYVRGDQWARRMPFFVVRSERDPQALIAEVRTAIRKIDPRVAVAEMQTMDEIVTDALRQQRISAVLIAGFALGALLLVAMGLFGVIAGSVARRRGELAVRLALGATHGSVLRLVIGEGARLIALGLLIGVPGIYLSGQAIRSVLIGVSPFDAPTLISVAVGLAGVALLACYLAARRVTSIEPSSMLRDEG
jgi:putative ABC transport system permease protein